MAPALSIVPQKKKSLGLHPGPAQRLSILEALHFLLILVAPLFTCIPASILKHYVLLRAWSPVASIGRPIRGFLTQFTSQQFFGRASVAQARLLLNQSNYKKAYAGAAFEGIRDWVKRVDLDTGVSGWWIARPDSRRQDDDVVVLYIHGGGFVLDTGASVQEWFGHLTKELSFKRGLKVSVFSLDYELAPDFKYPSQLIETLASYHYLVNDLHVSEDRILVLGDSAGGNLTEGFLLHLARPNPNIKLPESYGQTPKQPRAAVLVSPMHNLTSKTRSRSTNAVYDIIDDGTCFRMAHQYVNAPLPRGTRTTPTWNPFFICRGFPNSSPTAAFKVFNETRPLEAEEGQDASRQLGSPYANPSVCKDIDWWKKAMPGDGRTMVTWGGKEIFADDDEALVEVLEKAGVEPTKLYKANGVHNWSLFDAVQPGIYKTNSKGPENTPEYGLQRTADFIVKHFKA